MLVLLFTAFLPKVGVRFAWVQIHWIAGHRADRFVIFHIIHATFFLDFWSIWPDKHRFRGCHEPPEACLGKPFTPPRKFGKYPFENKMFHLAFCAPAFR